MRKDRDGGEMRGTIEGTEELNTPEKRFFRDWGCSSGVSMK